MQQMLHVQKQNNNTVYKLHVCLLLQYPLPSPHRVCSAAVGVEIVTKSENLNRSSCEDTTAVTTV